MTNDIVIRSARTDERDTLSDLAFRSKAFWGYSPEFMEACRAELSISDKDMVSTSRSYVVAEAKDEILGYYALENLSPDKYELEALFVAPQHIGQGIGRRLIEHAMHRAREGGARFLLIQGDPNAADFYRAVGGIEIGERESDSIPGRFLPVFRVSLVEENEE